MVGTVGAFSTETVAIASVLEDAAAREDAETCAALVERLGRRARRSSTRPRSSRSSRCRRRALRIARDRRGQQARRPAQAGCRKALDQLGASLDRDAVVEWFHAKVFEIHVASRSLSALAREFTPWTPWL